MRSPGAEQHVHLAAGLDRADVVGQPDQVVGGLAHGADHHHHVVAGPAGAGHVVGHGADPVGVGRPRCRRTSGPPETWPPRLQAASGAPSERRPGDAGGPGRTGYPEPRAHRETPTSEGRPAGPAGGRAEGAEAQADRSAGSSPSVIVAAVVVGISVLPSSESSSEERSPPRRTTKATTTTTTTGPAAGGSGNTSPAAITTSADCPSELHGHPQQAVVHAAPPMTIDTSKTYTATITTDVGPFTIQLDPKTAPMAVNSFVFLAEHHFYDCVIFHRVIPTFMDQTGDPTGTGTGGPGYQFTDELPDDGQPPVPARLGGHGQLQRPPTPTAASSSSWPAPRARPCRPTTPCSARSTSGMSVVDKINAGGSASAATPARRSPPPDGLGHHHRVLVPVAVGRTVRRSPRPPPTPHRTTNRGEAPWPPRPPQPTVPARRPSASTARPRWSSTRPSATRPRWSPPRAR